jgi:hypothetical protein
MRRLLLGSVIAVGAVLPMGIAEARTFGPADIAVIAETASSNEMRFNRDYKGQTLEGTLSLVSIHETLTKGKYRVTFGPGGFFEHNVDCKVQDQQTIDLMTDWHKGQKVTVRGIITDTALGDIQLSDCSYRVS